MFLEQVVSMFNLKKKKNAFSLQHGERGAILLEDIAGFMFCEQGSTCRPNVSEYFPVVIFSYCELSVHFLPVADDDLPLRFMLICSLDIASLSQHAQEGFHPLSGDFQRLSFH